MLAVRTRSLRALPACFSFPLRHRSQPSLVLVHSTALKRTIAMSSTSAPNGSSSGFAPAPGLSKSDSTSSTSSSTFDYTGPGAVIPPTTDHRTLVLCFDGTGDQFDADNSNIVQLFAMLNKGVTDKQLVYYQAGIGTYTIPQIATPLYSKFSKTWDLMVATSLDHHVMGGYEFLMENYKEGDKICIFGFSRGAYTARALAGMIQKVGLLPNGNHQQVPFAYHMFTQDNEEGYKQSAQFKATFSMDVDIEFVGVWDTVASVGLFPRTLPFTKSNTAIKIFRHAISLDERRAKFKPNFYQLTTKEEAEQNDFKIENQPDGAAAAASASKHHTHTKHDTKAIMEDLRTASESAASTIGNTIGRVASEVTAVGDEDAQDHHKHRIEAKYMDRSKQTDVLEVFFAGCHCDVGGGSVANDTRHALAQIPLRWMIRQCFLTKTGIQFHADKLRSIARIDPACLYPIVTPRPPQPPLTSPAPITWLDSGKHIATTLFGAPTKGDGDPHEPFVSEEKEDEMDALCPIYDQLSIAKWWWFLELLPMKERVQLLDGRWEKGIVMNLGRARVKRHQAKSGIRVHRSVKLRMEAEELKYTPRLKFEVDPIWED